MTTIPTADLGFIELSPYCPEWCDRHHVEYATENEGILDARDVTAHFSGARDEYLREIRNPVNKDIERGGGGGWNLVVRQYLRAPYADHCGYASPPLIELHVRDRSSDSQASLAMTTGAIRVFAAHLIALCDRVDLPR